MKTLIFCLAIVFGFSALSCKSPANPENPEELICGDSKHGYFWRTSHGTGFFSDLGDPPVLERTYYPGGTGGRSTVTFYKWVQNVCPDEHVRFKASLSAEVDGDFNVSAKAEWYFFFEKSLDLNISSDGVSRHWDGSGEFGLKQVYGDEGVGEFTLTATIDFPYQGSFAADTTYLQDMLQNVTLDAEYKLAKVKPSVAVQEDKSM